MRSLLFAAYIIICAAACNNNSNAVKTVVPGKSDTTKEKVSFFPVTSYLKGQIYEIAVQGTIPTKYITVGNHTDSTKLKFDQLNSEMAEFLHPEIDTANLIPFFKESKFLDQTVNAFTFTYEATPPLPDSITLRHWDVYIDPQTGKVTRIYMIKKAAGNKLLQLTWLSNKWCKMTTITNNPGGTEAIEKEEKISWEPEQQ